MNYYDNIKELLINNEITKKVKNYSINKSDLDTYYDVGKMLSEAGKNYGGGIIKEYSRRLTKELGKGYTFTALTRMKKFYILCEKLATVSQLLTWSHYCEILSIDNIESSLYYIKLVELKITEFKVEYISQVQKYMNYIDKNIKEITHNNTIGIVICKKENKYVIEYCSDSRIMVREYELV